MHRIDCKPLVPHRDIRCHEDHSLGKPARKAHDRQEKKQNWNYGSYVHLYKK